jgi:predicted transcriptional regulator
MPIATECDNPMCSCSPCRCTDCQCGSASLGQMERRVMDVLWDADGEMTGRAVADLLPEYAYTTIATVLDRLVRKGLARRRTKGRTIRYTAIGSSAAHTAVLMHETLRAGGDPEAALAWFVSVMSPQETRALRTALTGTGPGHRTDRPRTTAHRGC